MPPSVCRSTSSSGATLIEPVAVASGRFIGAPTARTRMPLTLSGFAFI